MRFPDTWKHSGFKGNKHHLYFYYLNFVNVMGVIYLYMYVIYVCYICMYFMYVCFYVCMYIFISLFMYVDVIYICMLYMYATIDSVRQPKMCDNRLRATTDSVRQYFSFQPVLHDWCNKGRGMCYPVCGMVHIEEPLLLIDKSSLCGGSGFPFSLSEWSLTICLTPYNRR